MSIFKGIAGALGGNPGEGVFQNLASRRSATGGGMITNDAN